MKFKFITFTFCFNYIYVSILSQERVKFHQKYPSVAVIANHISETFSPLCLGTLVTNDIVLTTCHCTRQPLFPLARFLSVYVGVDYWKHMINQETSPYSLEKNSEEFQRSRIRKIILHKDCRMFSDNRTVNDYAIVMVLISFSFTNSIQPVKFYESRSCSKSCPKKHAVIIKWGKLNSEESNMKITKMGIVKKSSCEKLETSYNPMVTLTEFIAMFKVKEDLICTIRLKQQKGFELTDIDGLLFVNNELSGMNAYSNVSHPRHVVITSVKIAEIEFKRYFDFGKTDIKSNSDHNKAKLFFYSLTIHIIHMNLPKEH